MVSDTVLQEYEEISLAGRELGEWKGWVLYYSSQNSDYGASQRRHYEQKCKEAINKIENSVKLVRLMLLNTPD